MADAKLTALTAASTLDGTELTYLSQGGASRKAALTALGALFVPLTTLGDVIYGGASGATTRLAGNTTTTKKFLRQTGTGTASAAPAWDTLDAGDIPAIAESGVTGLVSDLAAKLTGTGTTGKLPKWTTGGSVLGDSLLSESGGNVTLASGQLIVPNGLVTAPSFAFADGHGWFSHNNDYISLAGNNTNRFTFGCGNGSGYGLILASNSPLTWCNGNDTYTGAVSLNLFRDADNIFAQRNGTANQQSNLYETYTDAGNYSRLVTKSAGTSGYQMYPEAGGTGTQRVLQLSDNSAGLRYCYLDSVSAQLGAQVGGVNSGVSCMGSTLTLTAGNTTTVKVIAGALTAGSGATSAQLRLNNTEGSVLEYTAGHNVIVDGTNVTITGNHLIFGTDNTKDIGASGATRPRNIYVAGTIFGGHVPIGIYDEVADAANTSTTETTLYSDGIGAARLAINKDKVIAQYGGTFTGAASATQQLRVYFGPNGTNADTLVFDSGALSIATGSPSWDLYVTVIRESSSVVRVTCSLTTSSAALAGDAQYTRVTSLTLTANQFVTLTGTSGGVGGGSSQVTASEGYGQYAPAA